MATKRPRRKAHLLEPPVEQRATEEAARSSAPTGEQETPIHGGVSSKGSPNLPASTIPRAPQGAIQTPDPKGGSFGISWSRINQYDELIARSCDEKRVPFGRLKAVIPIESGGDPGAVQRNPRGWTYGLTQPLPYTINNPKWSGHHALVARIAGIPDSQDGGRIVDALYDPETNLRVGAAILRDNYDRYGTWDRANSAFFLGNPDWDGGDGVNGTTGAQYKRSLDGLLGEIWAADDGTVPDPGGEADPWRPYPWPAMVDLIVSKPYDGAGFDRVSPRGPRIKGSINHITDGRGSIEWYSAFFSTGGERARDALTDLVIGRDGRIGLLNDWRDPNRGGMRAGWANGTATGIEGDGLAFYRRYPLINDVLVSKEHEGRAGEPMTDAQMAASIALSTANAQAVRCPWDAYPYHPAFGGVNIEQMHYLFAPKSCPAEPFISTYYPVLISEVRANLKAWQGGISTGPSPEPDPVWYTRFGFSLDEIASFFGSMTRFNQDGTTDELPFDPAGPVSLLWLERCDREGVFPEAERIWCADAQFVDGKEVWASFEGGWTAFLALEDSRASWRWLGQEAA